MAQDEAPESPSFSSSAAATAAGRLNAAALEFTPRSDRRWPQQQHHRHKNHGEDEGDAQLLLSEKLSRQVVKQVEFYFSDVNLASTDHLMKFITKDPDGYVPMSIVASFRKIRELINGSLLPAALRTSSKLVVSDDGKMVRRRVPFSEVSAEEVQSRIIVAEKLPEDHRYKNLMKIFSYVGSVKSIRTCYPQRTDMTGSAAGKSSRIEKLFANKLHAFVEYRSVKDAEKAVAEFSSGRDWRDGPRVRSLLGCLKNGLGQGRKDGDEEAAEEDGDESEDENQEGGMWHHWGGQGCGARGHPITPRMPDGTNGFTMGRGKPSVSSRNGV